MNVLTTIQENLLFIVYPWHGQSLPTDWGKVQTLYGLEFVETYIQR